jgi:hypothetical protein
MHFYFDYSLMNILRLFIYLFIYLYTYFIYISVEHISHSKRYKYAEIVS